MNKISLSDKDFECLAKGLAIGAGIGIFLGLFIDNIIISFSGCSIIGIFISLIYSKLDTLDKGYIKDIESIYSRLNNRNKKYVRK